MQQRETITIYRNPTHGELIKWAESAFRNVQDGALSSEAMEDILRDFSDGLTALQATARPELNDGIQHVGGKDYMFDAKGIPRNCGHRKVNPRLLSDGSKRLRCGRAQSGVA